jgi:hypothetical protein
MAAEVLANELQLDLYRIDLSAVVSKYIGETEKNLRRVFDAAESGGAVLCFDEADALFGKRSEVKDSHDRYANVEISYLLQRMEQFDGLAVLTTNLKSAIDPAFMRRLRFVVDFPFPDVEHRRRIWQQAFPVHLAGGLSEGDWDRLARFRLTGGHIVNIALNAAFRAAAEGLETVQVRHILASARANASSWNARSRVSSERHYIERRSCTASPSRREALPAPCRQTQAAAQPGAAAGAQAGEHYVFPHRTFRRRPPAAAPGPGQRAPWSPAWAATRAKEKRNEPHPDGRGQNHHVRARRGPDGAALCLWRAHDRRAGVRHVPGAAGARVPGQTAASAPRATPSRSRPTGWPRPSRRAKP